MKGANHVLVKLVNQRLVRQTLKDLRQATKQQLAHQTGLSVVTINALLTEMIEEGEVRQGELVPSNGGRPSVVYHYNGDFQHAVIIYAYQRDDQHYMKLLVVNLLEELVHEEAAYIGQVVESSFEGMLDRAFKQFPSIHLIAFGLPGAEQNGRIMIHDYPALIGATFIPHYQERYRTPVIFANDINAAVKGYDHRLLSEHEAGTVVGVYFPRLYPPGAGIIMNGEIYTGNQNYAGEVGQFPMGCDWTTLDYTNGEAVTRAVGQLIAMISTVLAPTQFILYGDFWGDDSHLRIREYAEQLLKRSYSVQVDVSAQFEQDFEQGMIQISLRQLDKMRE